MAPPGLETRGRRARLTVWTAPPKMNGSAPQPTIRAQTHSLWLAYRTERPDHFAVVRFSGVVHWTLCGPDDADLPPEIARRGLESCAFHELASPAPPRGGMRRWVVTFPGETLEVTARDAELVVRAIQAADARHALSMVLA
jgi:hypothetical protein